MRVGDALDDGQADTKAALEVRLLHSVEYGKQASSVLRVNAEAPVADAKMQRRVRKYFQRNGNALGAVPARVKVVVA